VNPSLREVALGAIARRLPAEAERSPLAQVLHDARVAVRADWSADGPGPLVRAMIAAAGPRDAALATLASAYELSELEILAIALVLAAEEEPAVRGALSLLQAGEERPTLGLFRHAVADLAADLGADCAATALVTGVAMAAGLLLRDPDAASFGGATLRLPLPLLVALHGGVPPVGTIAVVPPELPASMVAQARAHASSLGSRETLVVRGGDDDERRAAAALVAQASGRRALVVSAAEAAAPGLAAACVLGSLLPAIVLPAGERSELPELAGRRTPRLVMVGKGTACDGGGAFLATWRLVAPTAAERLALWRGALGECPAADAGSRIRSGSVAIPRLAARVRARAAQAGHVVAQHCDLRSALRSGDHGLGALAVPVFDDVPDAALVVPAHVREQLELLELRCRERDRLGDGLGASFVARTSRGVRALLVGGPGTGKSLAAAWLATRLGQPLYRVDLAAVASKYIGETEQNLARLLDAAETSDVMLLFDEADALFANRTDVRDASDRHANAVVNYVLIRLEEHDGIVMLSANTRSRFDSGLTRRLDVLLELAQPGPSERRALWISHLGESHTLSGTELSRLAGAADLSGGHIRNVVLTAALVARSAGRKIEWRDVIAGLAAEHRKLGRAMPAELLPRSEGGP
jgi:hypothetical protein